MTDATELDEAAVRAQIREHVIRCRVERGYGEGNDEAFASTDATFLLTALDKARTDLPAALDEITRLRAALTSIRTLARSWSGRHDLLMTGDSAARDIEAALAATTTTERSEG